MQLVKTLAKKITVKSVVRFFGHITILALLFKTFLMVAVAFLSPYALGTGVLMPLSLFIAASIMMLLATVGTMHVYENIAVVALNRLTERLPA
jgi:hypothetical protein